MKKAHVECEIHAGTASGCPWPKTINVFRACLGAQLTICAQKCRNFVLFSMVSFRFVLSRVCVFLYSLGPWSCTLNVGCGCLHGKRSRAYGILQGPIKVCPFPPSNSCSRDEQILRRSSEIKQSTIFNALASRCCRPPIYVQSRVNVWRKKTGHTGRIGVYPKLHSGD